MIEQPVLHPPEVALAASSSTRPEALGIVAAEKDSFFPAMQRDALTIGKHTVHVETGRLARAANGSVLLQCGETLVFVAATASKEPRTGIDFFPLLVDFEEKMYSVGRLPGGFIKREGRPSEKAVLTSRLIDRPIRPLFPDGYRNDVQIVANPISSDSVNPPDVLAILGASLALVLSEGVPFMGPLGAVRVGRVAGEFVLNPTFKELEDSDLDLVVAGTQDSIMMVEAGAEFVSEEDMLSAIELAHTAIKEQVAFQLAFAAKCGVNTEWRYQPELDTAPLVTFVAEQAEATITTAYHEFDRERRQTLLSEAKQAARNAVDALDESHSVRVLLDSTELDLFGEAFKKVEKRVMRAMVVNEGVRADGRKPDEIRPIQAQVGLIPRVHGSALFTRGSTQALSIATLGAPGEAQRLDGVDPATEKRWIHHYAFPSYSVGEVRPMRGPGRREIGHGALAERAVLPSLPDETAFPYVIRVNSEIMESNGSTSMASTCGATLALMDAGVPLKQIVGGIAMGLIKEGDRTVVLSDIQGVEDFLGDMDFKVTGTRDAVTALQMDIKIKGISVDIMREALIQARTGRLHILDKMAEAIQQPRAELSRWAPRIITIQIEPDMIGTVIGPGGKMIRSIIEETGATIDIEDSGRVVITSVQGEGGERAVEIIENLTRKIEPGMMIVGKVVGTIPVGAFVQLAPGRDGMIHISQFPVRVPTVEDAVKLQEDVLVRVVDVDEKGRISLTMKGITNEQRAEYGLPPLEFPEFDESAFRSREDRGPRGGGGGGGGRDRGPRGGGGGGGFRGGDRNGPRGGGGGGGRDRY